MRRLTTPQAWIRACVVLSALSGLPSLESTAAAQNKRAPSQTKKSLPADAQAQLKQAMTLFRANRYKEASAIFSRLLRTYPDNETARIYLGKSLFRMDRHEESYQVFRTLNLKTLDPETSFEYGKSFFDHEQYEEAFSAMLQVPEGNDYYDLASYYGAISAVKLKRFRDAERMIENAVVLPSKLIKSRNLYKQHIHQIIEKEQEEQLSRDKAAEEKRLKDQTRVFREKLNDPNEKPPVKEVELPVEPTHDGFYSINRSAEVGFRIKEQFVDFNRVTSRTNRHHTNIFTFQNGVQKILGKRDKNSTSAMGAGIKLNLWDRNYHNPELLMADTPDELTIYRTFTGEPDGNQKIGLAAMNAWYEKNVSGSLWLGTKVAYIGAYPDFKSKDSIANRDIEINLGRKKSGNVTSMTVNYIQTIDGSGRLLTETSQEVIGTSFYTPQSYGFDFRLRAQQFRYRRLFLEGPSNSIRGHVNLFSEFPYGTRLGSEGYFQTNHHYRKTTLPGFKWEQNDIYGALYLAVKPFSWLTFDIRGSRLQRVFNSVDPDGDANVATLEKSHPNFIAETSMSLMLNLLF